MNALDKARAFALIAEHLPADGRRKAAEAIAAELCPPTSSTAATVPQVPLAGLEPDADPVVAAVVDYLESIVGLREGALVRAVGVLVPRARAWKRDYPKAVLHSHVLAELWPGVQGPVCD